MEVLDAEEDRMFQVILFVAIILVIVLVCGSMGYRWQKEFEDRFPPISDEEFMARCRPGTRPEVALKVRSVLAEALNIEYERIYPSSRLVEDLGAE